MENEERRMRNANCEFVRFRGDLAFRPPLARRSFLNLVLDTGAAIWRYAIRMRGARNHEAKSPPPAPSIMI